MTNNATTGLNLGATLSQTLAFSVSAKMIDEFANLTGDFNALHVDKAFGRRSGFRENIVHGMLPLLFIAAWPASQSNGQRYGLQKISACFLKPVFAGGNFGLRLKVNRVVPSIAETDLSKQVPKMFLERMKTETPMQRIATLVDVAKAVVMLASSLASFTTGQKFMVTGGSIPLL